MVKTFVLDTNVLLHNADALTSFADNEVVITLDVLEELDKFKTEGNDLGRNARQAIRTLDSLRAKGLPRQRRDPQRQRRHPSRRLEPVDVASAGFAADIPDNRMIAVAKKLQDEGRTVIFVSKDINARVKADAVGVTAMDFEKQKVDFDNLYTGWTHLEVPGESIDRSTPKRLSPSRTSSSFPTSSSARRQGRAQAHRPRRGSSTKKGAVVPLSHDKRSPFGIRPRNLQQPSPWSSSSATTSRWSRSSARPAPARPSSPSPPASTWSSTSSATKSSSSRRPVVPLGRDIGYLPGTKDEKLYQWMEPIFDNLEYILRSNFKKPGEISREVKKLIDNGTLVLEALTYMRGRSIPGQYLIVDEAQNLTPHEVKTVVSRVGEDSKIVLTGDPYQIDNPYLDSSSNGLTYAADRMKSQRFLRTRYACQQRAVVACQRCRGTL